MRAVDAEKQRRIAIAAREYGYRAQVEAAKTRFDIVSVMLGSPPRVEWRRDAFRVRVTYNQSLQLALPGGRPRLPELRKDPITGRWVIIATDRAKRPGDFIRQPVPPAGQTVCPF
jgi:hypothetical protein